MCESCGHYADADAAVVIANRASYKLGIASLPLVKRKVTPRPEITGELSEAEAPTSKVEYIQLDLFDLKTEWETG